MYPLVPGLHWLKIALGGVITLFFWCLATCRLSCLLWFQRKISEQLRVLWSGFELESDGQNAVHCSCAESGGLKGGARTTQTTCCRPPSSPQSFAVMAADDCRPVAGALCSQRWCVSPAELLASPVATGPAWILSLLPSLLLAPLSHGPGTLCQHQSTEAGRVLAA